MKTSHKMALVAASALAGAALTATFAATGAMAAQDGAHGMAYLVVQQEGAAGVANVSAPPAGKPPVIRGPAR